MKRFAGIASRVVLFALIGVGAYAVAQQFIYRPCTSPITYRLGTFDTRFGVSKANFLAAVKQAGDIWSHAVGKPLFEYATNGSMDINLIYDDRQEQTQVRSQLNSTITTEQSQYDTAKQTYTTLRREYDTALANYNAAQAAFQQQADAYQSQVEYWNSRGGAPAGEYAQLQQEHQSLQASQDSLSQQLAALNDLGNRVQAAANQVNSLAGQVNSVVNQYNSGSLVGKEFDAGLFIQNGSQKTINIYQFDNQDKLVRVLAHELGHSLGLDHNSNPQSIMYALNQSTNEKLSSQDLSSLKTLCGIK